MIPYLKTDVATLYHARAEEVYPHIDPGSVSMIWSDGPYAMRKAAWDMMGVDGLADWYAPHIEAWGRICAPSATVYLWNTAEGWARIDPVMRAAGWVFRVLVTWDKGIAQATNYHMTWEQWRYWPEVTEVCGVYQREQVAWEHVFGALAARMETERRRCGLARAAIDAAAGCSNVSQYWWQAREWRCPTREMWALLQAISGGFVWSYDDLKAEERAARDQYEAHRAPFTCPVGVSNVWSHPQVSGRERLTIDGETHPCQKPLAFASRAILASTRIGDTVLDCFGGTQRIAVACRRLPPEERRHAIGIEMEQRWFDAVRPSLIADHGAEVRKGQPSLFAR